MFISVTTIGGKATGRTRTGGRVIARQARHSIRREQLDTLKLLAWPLAGLAALFAALVGWFALTTGPTSTWIAVGALTSTWFWLTVGFVMLLSGTFARSTGLEAQDWTSGALRSLEGDGWRSVAGIPLLHGGDIDNVAIGPGGVLAIETKWCQHWNSGRYARSQLERAAKQARVGARQVHFLLSRDQRSSLTVEPLVVVWGRGQADLPEVVDGVRIVRGVALCEELRRRGDAGVEAEEIDAIAKQIDAQAERWDELEARRAPAVSLLIEVGPVEILRRVNQGVVGGLGGLLAAAFLARWLAGAAGPAIAPLAAVAALIVAGMVLRWRTRWEWAGLGMLTAGLGIAVVTALGVLLVV